MAARQLLQSTLVRRTQAAQGGRLRVSCFSSSSGSSSASTSARGTAAASSPTPIAGLGGVRGKGGLASIFDRSLKQHYQANKPALDRIALSFLFFYCTGHMFMQKQRRDELEEELAILRREKKGLEASLRDEAWAKEVAQQLGVRDPSRLLGALALRMRQNAGELTREDMARPTMSSAEEEKGGAAVVVKGNAMF